MKTMLRLFCLFVLSSFAGAHVPFPNGTALVIPLGEERSFYIVADVQEENATAYSYKGNTNDTIAAVEGRLSFSQKEYGSWRIRAKAVGTTTLTFHWKYAKDKSGNEGEDDESVIVQVVEPGTSAAANPYHISIADPVNSRNGEYHSDEVFGPLLGGPMPLGFSSYYSSSLTADGVPAGALGTNRLHNFEWKLTSEAFGRRVKVRNDHGRVFTFEKQSLANVWTQTGRKDIVVRLMEEEGIFYFFTPASQKLWLFDATGKLTKIMDGRGNTQTLAYAGNTLTSVADSLGRTLTFTHGGARLTRVEDHTGRHVNFAYTGNNLTQFTNALGHITTFTYDAANLLTSFTKPEGNSPFTQVFTNGKVTAQTERGSDTTAMAYNGNSTTITQPGGATMTHAYAPTGEIAAYTDEAGKTIALDSDATGRRNGVIDRDGGGTVITYHALSGLPATLTNAQGHTSTLTYKPRLLKLTGIADVTKALTFFDLAKITFADGTNESFVYDAFGNLLARTDRAGKKWMVTYDPHGLPLTIKNPASGTVTMTYDAAGNLISIRDSATGSTTLEYDAQNRPITITHPGGATASFTYDANDRLLTLTDERNQTTALAYDTNGRLTGITDADANALQFVYDVLDRQIQFTDRLGKTSSRTFDARRLIASATDRNGNITSFVHDVRQRLTGVTDPGGKTWSVGYDNESQAVSAANPIDAPGRIKRNALGRPVEVSNPLGHTTRVVRDAMQRVTQLFDPLGRVTAFTYDKRGDLIGVAEQGGGSAKFTRDALGKVTAIAAPDGGIWKATHTQEGRVQATIDPLGNSWQRTYDQRGRLSTLHYPDSVIETLTYDAANNVTRVQTAVGATVRQTFDFTYDNLNRLASVDEVAVAGTGITFSYDAESRLTNSLQNGINFAATYDDGGRLKTVSYNNGALVVSYAYDSRNRLVQVGDSLAGAQVAFGYDDAGRITSLTRANGVNASFAYDGAGRLTHIQDGVFLNLEYTRNAAGEITVEDRTVPLPPSAVAAMEIFKFGKAGQVTSAGFTYDSRGRLITAPGHTFAWDDANRLVSNNAVTFGYNPLGEIITRAAAGATTRHFHHHAIAGAPIIAERAEATATFTRYYIHTPGGRLLYSVDATNNQVSYHHFDQLGSTLALSDAAGAVTDQYAYGPFGENAQHTGPSTQPFTWLGALGVRQEGSLFHMGRRYYDPRTARFLSRDPLPPRLADVKSLNPYAYANQNPLRYVDPFGGRTFVLPHVLEKDGDIAQTPLSFDNTLFGAGPPPGSTPDLDLFLFDGNMGFSIQSLRSPLDIVRENAAKFGGTVHSTARGMVNQVLEFGGEVGGPIIKDRLWIWESGPSASPGFKSEENDSPRPVDRVFFRYDQYQMLLEVGQDSLPLGGEFIGDAPRQDSNPGASLPVTPAPPAPPAPPVPPPAPAPGFDPLNMLNNINRINPASWFINWHAPFTKP